MTKDGISSKIEIVNSVPLNQYLEKLDVEISFIEEYTWFFNALTEFEDNCDSKIFKNSSKTSFITDGMLAFRKN